MALGMAIDSRLGKTSSAGTVIHSDQVAQDFGEAHGWSDALITSVDQALVVVLSGHTSDEKIRYSELISTVRHRGRVAEILDQLALLDDVRPQTPQRTSGRGRQRVQIGPAAVITATRRWSPQPAQVFQLRGSRHQQGWQMAWPLSFRRAGGLTFPQRPQGMATAFLVQLAHNRSPLNDRPSFRCRPQRGHDGSTTVAAPARTRA